MHLHAWPSARRPFRVSSGSGRGVISAARAINSVAASVTKVLMCDGQLYCFQSVPESLFHRARRARTLPHKFHTLFCHCSWVFDQDVVIDISRSKS